MPLFQFSYRILDHWKVHSYGGDDSSEKGCIAGLSISSKSTKLLGESGCILHGRWHEWGRKQGLGVLMAPDAQVAYEWLLSWADPCCSIELIPVLDDASLMEFRGTAVSPSRRSGDGGHGIGYDTLIGPQQEPWPGETIYIIHFKFLQSGPENDHRVNAKTFFRRFQPVQGVRIQARYHDLGMSSGWIIAAASGERELYGMFYALLAVAEINIRPVLTDHQLFVLLAGQSEHHLSWFQRKLGMYTCTSK